MVCCTAKLRSILNGRFKYVTGMLYRNHRGYPAGSKWTAQTKDQGRKIHLGSYLLLEDATEARLKTEEELWGDIR